MTTAPTVITQRAFPSTSTRLALALADGALRIEVDGTLLSRAEAVALGYSILRADLLGQPGTECRQRLGGVIVGVERAEDDQLVLYLERASTGDRYEFRELPPSAAVDVSSVISDLVAILDALTAWRAPLAPVTEIVMKADRRVH